MGLHMKRFLVTILVFLSLITLYFYWAWAVGKLQKDEPKPAVEIQQTETPLLTVAWSNHPVLAVEGYAPGSFGIDGRMYHLKAAVQIEIGLRSDGVVVWRLTDPNSNYQGIKIGPEN